MTVTRMHSLLAALVALDGASALLKGSSLHGNQVKPDTANLIKRCHTNREALWLNDTRFSASAYSDLATCSLDVSGIVRDLGDAAVLFVGSSLDERAMLYFCEAAGSAVVRAQTSARGLSGHTLAEPGETLKAAECIAGCSLANFAIGRIFHPGAGEGPYFQTWENYTYDFNETSKQLVARGAPYVAKFFSGRQPTIVVVDSSLWDISKWWQNNGKPPSPFPVPRADIQRWCRNEVRGLLDDVATAYPRSRVAFRTAPTVWPGDPIGQSAEIVEAMTACLESQVDTTSGLLYGKYQVVPYHDLVDEALSQRAATQRQALYQDRKHPGPQLSLAYVDYILRQL